MMSQSNLNAFFVLGNGSSPKKLSTPTKTDERKTKKGSRTISTKQTPKNNSKSENVPPNEKLTDDVHEDENESSEKRNEEKDSSQKLFKTKRRLTEFETKNDFDEDNSHADPKRRKVIAVTSLASSLLAVSSSKEDLNDETAEMSPENEKKKKMLVDQINTKNKTEDEDNEKPEELSDVDEENARDVPLECFGFSIQGDGVADLSATRFHPSVPQDVTCPSSAQFGESLKFSVVAQAWKDIEELKGSGLGSKKKAITVLANLFRLILVHCPSDLAIAVYLCANMLAPGHFGLETGIGDGLLMKSVSETYGRSDAQLRNELKESGDLGICAENSKISVRTLMKLPQISLRTLFSTLHKVAQVSGSNSQNKKKDLVKKLLVSAVLSEPRYLVRILQGSLRIGLQMPSIFAALSIAFSLSPPKLSTISEDDESVLNNLMNSELPPKWHSVMDTIQFEPDIRTVDNKYIKNLDEKIEAFETAIRSAYSELPNIPFLIYHLLRGSNEKNLKKKCFSAAGVPVSPMLAKPTKGFEEIASRLEGRAFLAEYKYDGERCQIHKLPNGNVLLFSRNMENLTVKYPDLISTVQSAVNADTLILDSEVVAFDPKSNLVLPFQTLSKRKRKDVTAESVEVTVCLFVFDCLYLNGEPLVRTSLRERREKMRHHIVESPGALAFAVGKEGNATEDLDGLLQEAVENRTEGLMVKLLDGPESFYAPANRSRSWLKLKKDYIETLGDTIDMVPIGAWYGKGKRSGVYGSFLLAVYDSEDEMWRTACKVATGCSDDDLSVAYEYFKDKLLPSKPAWYHVVDKLYPDVWFPTTQVWECRAADLSISPVHTAGWSRRSPNKGIGLRFPRFLTVREDKKVDDATNSDQIVELYDNQFRSEIISSITT